MSTARHEVRLLSLGMNPRMGDRPEHRPVESAATIPEARVVEAEPALFGVTQAARYLGVGRTEVFKILRQGRLRSLKVGRRRLIPRAALDTFVAEEMSKEE